MRKVGVICKREVLSYFQSPVAYVIIAAFLAISGYLFAMSLFATQVVTMEITFGNLAVIFLFVAPMFTLRTLAEERRQGTDEFLLTAPLGISEMVVGKYLATVAMMVVILIVSLIYPLILSMLGRLHMGPLLSGYLGLFLLGGAFLAVGIFASSLTENQMVAGMLGFAMLLLLWLVSWAATLPGIWGTLASALSVFDRYGNFVKGVIDTVDLIFYVSFIFVFLFLTIRVIDRRRWS